MKGIILAGGLGTRLRPLTYRRPKPVVPLMGKPFLEYQLKWLESNGITEVALCLHYQAEQVQHALEDGSRCGVHLTYFYEETPLGTGGALSGCADFWGDGPVVVLNGDVLVDLNLYAMVDLHMARGSAATIALVHVADPTAYGLVVVKPDGRVERFVEKPGWDQASGHSINAGVYVLNACVRDHLPAGREVSIEREVFPGLLKDGFPVFSFRDPFYWLDIGTPEHLMQAHFDLLHGGVRSDLAGSGEASRVWIHETARVDPGVRLVPPVFIGPGAQVGPGAMLGPAAVIGAGSVITGDCEINNSVLLEGVRVGTSCHISRCLFDSETSVAEGAQLSGWLLAAGTVLGRGCRSIRPGEDGVS